MSPLNENHVRHLVATFDHVDRLLRAVGRLCQTDDSPFARERQDLSVEEIRMLRAAIATVRDRMLAALDRLGVRRPAPSASTRQAAIANLLFADIDLSELTIADLRGYGAVDELTAAEVGALATELRLLIGRARTALDVDATARIEARLAGLPGVPGGILRGVQRLATEHSLVDVRPLILAAAERLDTATFDVGVFGRVSSGKSSLINALIGTAVLPVGAVPVTAVPLRMTSGAAGAMVHMQDGAAIQIGLGELVTYSTEAENPDNVKGVDAIDVWVPTVPVGLRFVDTPGVGSLAAGGQARAFAWLPRCDLGLVLVPAGTPMGREELALVSGLVHAGLRCQMLLSKCDLLSSDDLHAALTYVRRELVAVLGAEHGIAVLPISTLPDHSQSVERLRAHVLAPLAARHAAEARRALVARLRRLIALTDAALEGAVRQGDDGRVIASYGAVNAAHDAIRRDTDELSISAEQLLDGAADTVAGAWADGKDGTLAARHALVAGAAAGLARVQASIDRARATVEAGRDHGEPEGRRMPPLFDPLLLEALPSLPPSLGGRMMGTMIGRWRARRRLEPVRRELGDALSAYASRLYVWGIASVDELLRQHDPEDDGAPLRWAHTSRSGTAGEPTPARREIAHLNGLLDGMAGESEPPPRQGPIVPANRSS